MELYKVSREIQRHGDKADVYEVILDEYGEYKDKSKTGNISVLFHITKGYVSQSVGDATVSRSKGQPALIMSYDDSANINVGNIVMYNGKSYKVVDKNNVQEYNIVVDVSLEVFDDGS